MRHLQIDKRDFCCCAANALQRLFAVGSLADTHHIDFSIDQRRDACSQDRVIINQEDSNQASPSSGNSRIKVVLSVPISTSAVACTCTSSFLSS